MDINKRIYLVLSFDIFLENVKAMWCSTNIIFIIFLTDTSTDDCVVIGDSTVVLRMVDQNSKNL